MSSMFQRILPSDESLSEKITYDEYIRRCTNTAGVDDSEISEAFDTYCRLREELHVHHEKENVNF